MLLYHYPTCTVQLSNSFLLLRGCTFSVCEECREFLKAKGLNSDKQKTERWSKVDLSPTEPRMMENSINPVGRQIKSCSDSLWQILSTVKVPLRVRCLIHRSYNFVVIPKSVHSGQVELVLKCWKWWEVVRSAEKWEEMCQIVISSSLSMISILDNSGSSIWKNQEAWGGIIPPEKPESWVTEANSHRSEVVNSRSTRLPHVGHIALSFQR